MDVRTHHALDRELCGTPQSLEPGTATVIMEATARMAADAHGLVHGGFVFGLADHAAMLAVNEPTVVLGASTVRLTAPATVGQTLHATARVTEHSGKKHRVEVEVRADGTTVMTGEMTCFVPPRHVLAPPEDQDGDNR